MRNVKLIIKDLYVFFFSWQMVILLFVFSGIFKYMGLINSSTFLFRSSLVIIFVAGLLTAISKTIDYVKNKERNN